MARQAILPSLNKLDIEEERNRAEKTLEEAEARWRIALENSKEGVWEWNLKTDSVFYSDYWKNMLGYSVDEIKDNLGEFYRLVHPEDLKENKEVTRNHLNGKT